MTKLGWIAKHKDKTRQLEEVLRFFGVASPKQWQEVWHNYQVAYRQTQCLKTSAESVSAWLRRGEIEALEIKCAPFNRKRFLKILDDVRDLTRKSPNIFVPELVNLAASAGVAVVFVHELPKTGVFGATRWLKGKAVLQLSLRYKSNDHLWFTFFHEAGQEEEANAFARDKLIPPVAYRRFLSTWDGRSLEPIRRFAEEINVAPGIIVGRLQFEERLPRSHGNKLKVFYRWSQAS